MMASTSKVFIGEWPAPQQDELDELTPAWDLEVCPRCGEQIAMIVWGQTNCPRCGLHFECC